ncbi:MAG: hypothetical protein ABJF23_08700 [Bryobacteraceae bacterium]
MSGVIGQKASLGQGKGPDVDLIVTGTGTYATYETLDGFPAIYDDFLELFCYARVVSGAYESTAVPLRSPPPPDVERHSKESDSVRALKIARRRSELDRRARPSGAKE